MFWFFKKVTDNFCIYGHVTGESLLKYLNVSEKGNVLDIKTIPVRNIGRLFLLALGRLKEGELTHLWLVI